MGKTTLSIHLAYAIATETDKPVLLVDADPQGSASGWASVRQETSPFSVVQMARDTLHRDLPAIAAQYGHVIVDTPPRVSTIVRSAILSSDLILIPIQPSSYDIWATSDTVKIVQEIQQFKPDLKAAFVINRAIVGSVVAKDIHRVTAKLPFATLSPIIAQRVLFTESSAGSVVSELAPKHAAAKDIAMLSESILKYTGVEKW